MTFKKVITDINTLGLSFDRIKGVMGTINTSMVPNYTLFGEALKGLNTEQIALVLSTQKLSKTQLEQIIIDNELLQLHGARKLIEVGLLDANSALLASEKEVNATKLEETITQASLNKEKAKDFIQTQLKITANEEEGFTTALLNKELMDEAVKRGILSKEKADEILQSFGVITSDKLETVSKKGLTVATWELVKAQLASAAANPFVWVGAAIALLYGLYKAIDYINKAYERQKEKLEELSSAYNDTLSEIDNLESRLKDIEQNIEDIQSLGTLSLSNEQELQRLQDESKELDHQLKVEEALAKVRGKEAEEQAIKTLTTTQNSKYSYHVANSPNPAMFGNYIIYDQVTAQEELQFAMDEYDNWLSIKKEAEEKLDELKLHGIESGSEFETYSKQLTDADSKMTDAYKHAGELMQELDTQSKSLIGATDDGNALLQVIQDVSDGYDEWLDKVDGVTKTSLEDIQKHITDVLSNSLGTTFSDSLLNGLSDEQLEKIDNNLDNMISRLRSALSDGEISIEEFNDALSHLGETINEIPDLSVADAKRLISGSKDGDTEFTGLIDEFALLQEVIANTGDVSQETYEKLLSCSAKYSTALRTENGRITVNTTKLKQVAKQRQLDTKATIKETLAIKKQEWLQWKNKIENYNGTLLDSIITKYDDIDALQAEITQYELLVNSLDNATSAFERFKNAQSTDDQDMYNTAKDAFDVINKTLNASSYENYGKYNTDDFQEAVMLLMDTDTYRKALQAKDLKEYQDVVDGFVKSISPLFDENNAKSASKLFDEVDKIIASGDVPEADIDWANRLGISKEAFNALKQLANLYDYNNKEVFESFQLNKLDDYQEKLSNVAAEQEALNQITDKTSNEYLKQSKAVEQAKEKLDTFVNKTVTSMTDAFENFDKSGASHAMSFGEYLESHFDYEDTDIDGVILTLINKADTLRDRLKAVSSDESDWKSFKIYDQYKGLVDILSALGYQYETTTDNSKKFNDSLDDKFEKNLKMFQELKEKAEEFKHTMNDPTCGAEMYAAAKSGLEGIQTQLEGLRESLKMKLELDISDLEANISKMEKEREQFAKSNAGLEGTFFYSMQMQSYNQQIEKNQAEKADLEQTLKIVVEGAEEANGALEEIASFTIDDKEFSVSANDLASPVIDEINSKKVEDKEFNIKTNFKMPSLDFGGGSTSGNSVSGNTNAKGTVGNAFASGSYNGLPSNEKNALRSEYGQPELAVYPNGTYEITDTPTISDLPKGTVIFNGEQTKRILEGKAHADGTVGKAFNVGGGQTETGTYYNRINGKDVKTSSNAFNGSRNNTKKEIEEKEKEEEEKFEEIFDWIERRVKNFQTKFDRWIKQAETALTRGFIAKYYKEAAKNQKELMETQSAAYNRYMEEADKSGLSEEYKQKVRDGLIDIEKITDEALAKQINDYQDYYDKSISALDAFIEAAEKLYNIPIEKASQKIEKYSNNISLLDKRIDNLTTGLSKRADGAKAKNKLIDKQTSNEKNTLKAYQVASKETAKNLKSIGKELTKSSTLKNSGVSAKENKAIKKAVKNGKEIDLSYFTEGSNGYKAAVKYNEALKAQTQATYDLKVAQEDYNAWVVEAAKKMFDNVAADYEKSIQLVNNNFTDLDNKISELETAGKRLNSSYYQKQKKLNADMLAKYTKEKTELEKSIKNIKKYTDEWYEAQEEIQNVENSISNCVKETYNLNNAINQLHFDIFNDIADSISRIVTEQEFLQGLFTHEKIADDTTGLLTDAGIAKLGSLSASYYASQEKVNRDNTELDELRKMLNERRLSSKLLNVEFNSVEDLEKKYHEMYDTVQSDIKETYSLESSIADVMKEKYRAELAFYQDLINKQKEALQTEKDLHDYQNTINDKVTDIKTIQRQIIAYQGDSSEANMARLQKLQKELNEKQKDLRETEYDRFISDQTDMLDKLSQEYQEHIDVKLEQFQSLVNEGLNKANENLGTIRGYLSTVVAQGNNYTEETKGLFSGVSGSINTNVTNAVAKIIRAINAQSSETNTTTDIANNTKENVTNSGASKNKNLSAKEQINQDAIQKDKDNTSNALNKIKAGETVSTGIKETNASKWFTHPQISAVEYIDKHATVRKNAKGDYKKSNYTDVNQQIYSKYNKRALSTAQLKELTALLGEKYDNATKKGTLYKKLKALKVFKTGGIAKLVKDKGEDGITLARNNEAFVAPEHVPMMQEFLDSLPQMNYVADSINKMQLPQYDLNNMGNKVEYGDVTFNFEFPNVTDPDSMRKAIQTDRSLQKAIKSLTIDPLVGKSSLIFKNIR